MKLKFRIIEIFSTAILSTVKNYIIVIHKHNPTQLYWTRPAETNITKTFTVYKLKKL